MTDTKDPDILTAVAQRIMNDAAMGLDLSEITTQDYIKQLFAEEEKKKQGAIQ